MKTKQLQQKASTLHKKVDALQTRIAHDQLRIMRYKEEYLQTMFELDAIHNQQQTTGTNNEN